MLSYDLQLLNMSPHAPTSVSNLQQPPTPIDHLLDKNTPAPTPTDQHDNKSITASPYVHGGEPPSYTEHGGATGQVGQALTAPGSVPQQQPATPTSATATATTPAATGATAATVAATTAAVAPTPCGTISVKKLEMQQQPMLTIKQEPGTGLGQVAAARCGIVAPTTAVSTQEAVTNLFNLYKPPQLTLKDADSFYDEEWLKDVIYDFSFQESW